MTSAAPTGHIDGLPRQVRTRGRTPQQLGLLQRFPQRPNQGDAYRETCRTLAEAPAPDLKRVNH